MIYILNTIKNKRLFLLMNLHWFCSPTLISRLILRFAEKWCFIRLISLVSQSIYITYERVITLITNAFNIDFSVPTVIICFLTVLVFYLPSDSGEKIALSINILVSLSWFFLLLDEIIPPTSLAIPLIGKYLLFTFLLVVTSVFLTVGVLSVHFK